MKQPTPLLEESRDPLALELLRAWGTQRAPAFARERTAAALGVGAATVLGAGVANAGGALAAGSTLARLAVIKWLASGALCGLMVGGGVEVIRTRAFHTPRVTSQPQASSRPIAPSIRATDVRPAPPVAGVQTPSASNLPPRAASPSRASKPAPESIAQEIAALDRARQAMAQGRPNIALTELDQLESRGHSDTFAPELLWLRLEALDQIGQHERARDLALQALAKHPGGPLEKRLRARLR